MFVKYKKKTKKRESKKKRKKWKTYIGLKYH